MRLLLEFARAHPRSSAIALGCMVVAGAAEAIGISSVAPLIAIYGSDGQSTAEPNALVRMVNGLFAMVGLVPSVNRLLLLIFAAFVFKAIVVLFARRQVGYTVAHVVTQLRLRLVRALLRSRWGYYVDQKVGTFANAFSIEATRASKGYQNATHVVMLAIQFVFYLGVAIAASWRISATLFAMGILLVFVLRPLMTLGRKAGTRRTRLFRALLGRLTDLLQGVKPLKAMGREDLAAPLLEKGTLRVEKSLRLEVLSGEAITALQEPIIIAMILGGFYMMTSVLDVEVTAMAVLGLVTMRTFDVLNRFQRRYHRVVVEESAYWSLLRTVEEAEAQQERSHGGAEPRLDRAIDFDAIGFVYGEQKVFDALSLSIRAGQITALTGPSGAGKTTIVDLVAGLVEPSAGRVLIDGRSLAEIDLRSWRHRIGYVPQEMFLLHDTVAMNVSLGDPDLTTEDVEQALRDAHAWDFVEAMPDGVETVVGERGTRLSGGQRQRIAIARALVHHPWLLVLDEATAALDPVSEAIVWEAIDELRGRTTILAISHQQSLLDVADRAYEIRDGVAREIPTPRLAPAGAAAQ